MVYRIWLIIYLDSRDLDIIFLYSNMFFVIQISGLFWDKKYSKEFFTESLLKVLKISNNYSSVMRVEEKNYCLTQTSFVANLIQKSGKCKAFVICFRSWPSPQPRIYILIPHSLRMSDITLIRFMKIIISFEYIESQKRLCDLKIINFFNFETLVNFLLKFMTKGLN